MTDAKRVAVFGGSFNPPHVAHVLAVVYALEVAPIDEVLVVPVFRHPFAKELASFEDRMEMCRAAMGWIPRVSLSEVERTLGGDSLTLRTLEHLRAEHPTWSFRLLVGADVLADLPRWHRWDRISEIAPPFVLGRAGVTAESAPIAMLPQVSSTEVRGLLARGEGDAARALVPRAVLDVIAARGLYRGAREPGDAAAPEGSNDG